MGLYVLVSDQAADNAELLALDGSLARVTTVDAAAIPVGTNLLTTDEPGIEFDLLVLDGGTMRVACQPKASITAAYAIITERPLGYELMHLGGTLVVANEVA